MNKRNVWLHYIFKRFKTWILLVEELFIFHFIYYLYSLINLNNLTK